MPSRRDQIRMTDEEVRSFIAEHSVMRCATAGPRGYPHVVPLWYVPDGIELRSWTYAKSQKVRNLERDPRATAAIDEGLTYDELRGVMLECDVGVERDPERVLAYGLSLAERYGGASDSGLGAVDRPQTARSGGRRPPNELEEAFRKQAQKRVALHFVPRSVVSWDHRKLGDVY
jgi:hypothetical protein